jgi:hypothetical protein
MTTVTGWRDQKDFELAQSTRPQTLTNIPSALRTSGTKVAATLYSPDAVVWDLSGVTFSPPGFLSQFRPWFIPSAILMTLCAVGLWLRFDRVATVARIRGLRRSREREITSIERELKKATAVLGGPGEFFGGISALDLQWKGTVAAIEGSLRDIGAYSELSYQIRQMRLEFERHEKEIRSASTVHTAVRFEEFLVRLRVLEDKLEKFNSGNSYLQWNYRKRRQLTTFIWIVAASALICVIVILATLARAQARLASPTRALSLAMLCDLNITLTPHDTQAKPTEKVDVLLKFSPLSGDPHHKDVISPDWIGWWARGEDRSGSAPD